MKKKDRLLMIFLFTFSIFVSSGISVYATSTYLFNSSDVSYDNNNSSLVSANVQDALDELYRHSTDYTEINTRVTDLENPFKIEFTGITSSSIHGGYIDFHYKGSTDDYTSRIMEVESGILNLEAPNGVTINGNSLSDLIVVNEVFYSGSATVASGAAHYFNITITKSGYTPIGIVGWSRSNTTSFEFHEMRIISNTTAQVYFRNIKTDSETLSNFRLYVLYKKNL